MKDGLMKKILNKLANLLFPEKIKCMFCGKDIPDFDNKPYCDECENTLPFNKDNRCKICDLEIISNSKICDYCKHTHKTFDKARAPFKYEARVRKTVLKLKSDNAKYLAVPMAKLMVNSLDEDMKEIDFIIPVPMTDKSIKRRGYNQASLLANEIGKILNKPVRSDILIKVKDSNPQKELNFKDRQNNLKGVFSINNRKDIKSKNILLVDDVMTTSATANICSDLLKRHCNKVFVSVFARSMVKNNKNSKKISKNT